MSSDPSVHETGSEGVPAERRDAITEVGRLLAVVKPVAQAAKRFTGFFGGLAAASLSAAAVVWMVLFVPFGSFAVWKLVLAAVSLLLLLAPGLLLALFWLGLKQLMRLPDQIMSSAGQLAVSGRQVLSSREDTDVGWMRRLLVMLRSLVDVRSVLLESREVLVQAVLLVRIANPISILVVLGATALSGLLIAAAVLAIAVVAF